MLENWKLPLLMTVLAGFATVIGGFITFLVNKNNLKNPFARTWFFSWSYDFCIVY